ncbi:sensor histidine kinase [Streptomyces rubrogriseus]|uniref:sensor histidine kinase n=1 Tax=Streptomyces rubrogriseus TaxID=194673 RepID=UPI001FD311FA|nr:ATP-binding protein [Streptomyces rubrogriseus]
MSATSAPAPQHGMAWLEAVVGDGFTETLQDGLNRSRFGRARQTTGTTHPGLPADGRGPVAGPVRKDRDGRDDHVWAERRRLAREVHDELGTALSTAARHMELHAAETGEARHLDAALHSLREAMAVTRRLTGELQAQTVLPPLARALGDFAATTRPRRTEVRIRSTGDERLLSDVCRRELFLAVREALHNAFHHAHADRVTVTLRFTRRWAHAGIVDDGVGFDADAVLAPGHRAPGLRSMTDRVDDIGGRLLIASGPTSGTHIDVHLPLRPRK